ncbi:hypothetical protein CR513_55076, partial [Mucuna pruriens]
MGKLRDATWPLTKWEVFLVAYENSKICKENVKHFHDNMILRNEFKVDQKVLLFNSRLTLIRFVLLEEDDHLKIKLLKSK